MENESKINDTEQKLIEEQENSLLPALHQLELLQEWLQKAVNDKKIKFDTKKKIYFLSAEKDLQKITSYLNQICANLNSIRNKKLHLHVFKNTFRFIINNFNKLTQSLRLDYWNILSNKVLNKQERALKKETLLSCLNVMVLTMEIIANEFSFQQPNYMQNKEQLAIQKSDEINKNHSKENNNHALNTIHNHLTFKA